MNLKLAKEVAYWLTTSENDEADIALDDALIQHGVTKAGGSYEFKRTHNAVIVKDLEAKSAVHVSALDGTVSKVVGRRRG